MVIERFQFQLQFMTSGHACMLRFGKARKSEENLGEAGQKRDNLPASRVQSSRAHRAHRAPRACLVYLV